MYIYISLLSPDCSDVREPRCIFFKLQGLVSSGNSISSPVSPLTLQLFKTMLILVFPVQKKFHSLKQVSLRLTDKALHGKFGFARPITLKSTPTHTHKQKVPIT